MKTKQLLLCMVALLFSVTEMMATIYYVKTDGNDANTGLSWTVAKATVVAALDVAGTNDQIFVAQGRYLLTEEIYMRNRINVYGGFAGTETSLEQRPHLTFGETATGQATILDAQGSDNELRRALYQSGPFSVETIWDGFVIENGYATDPNMNAGGGGVYLDAKGRLNNSTIRYCKSLMGGAIYCRQDAIVSNCLITDNHSLGKAGGVACSDGSMAINCYIINNVSDVEAGGAYAGRDAVSAPGKGSALVNCLIANNTAVLGGGIYCSIAGIINCTIVNNHATDNGGGVGAYQNYPTLTNCVIWGNTKGTAGAAQLNGTGDGNTKAVINSAIQGGYGGNGASNITNLDAANTGGANSPEFILPATIVGRSIQPANVANIFGADWRLNAASAAKNKGTENVAIATEGTIVLPDIALPELDLNGHARINESGIDLGAYEYTVLSTDATLADLSLSAGTLTPAFAPAETSYSATVDYAVTSITVDALENQFNEKIGGAGVKMLTVGANTFTVTVTAEDRTTQQTYTVVVTRNEESGTAIDKVASAVAVKTYPNPVTDKLFIETANGELLEAKLYNLQGRLLLQTQSKEIDLSGFSAGTYLLKVDGNALVQKLIISK
jgi:hypothetical protein